MREKLQCAYWNSRSGCCWKSLKLLFGESFQLKSFSIYLYLAVAFLYLVCMHSESHAWFLFFAQREIQNKICLYLEILLKKDCRMVFFSLGNIYFFGSCSIEHVRVNGTCAGLCRLQTQRIMRGKPLQPFFFSFWKGRGKLKHQHYLVRVVLIHSRNIKQRARFWFSLIRNSNYSPFWVVSLWWPFWLVAVVTVRTPWKWNGTCTCHSTTFPWIAAPCTSSMDWRIVGPALHMKWSVWSINAEKRRRKAASLGFSFRSSSQSAFRFAFIGISSHFISIRSSSSFQWEGRWR